MRITPISSRNKFVHTYRNDAVIVVVTLAKAIPVVNGSNYRGENEKLWLFWIRFRHPMNDALLVGMLPKFRSDNVFGEFLFARLSQTLGRKRDLIRLMARIPISDNISLKWSCT